MVRHNFVGSFLLKLPETSYLRTCDHH